MTSPDGLYYVLSTVYFKIGRLSITCHVQKPQGIPESCDCRTFRLECLEAHNRHRKNHSAPELTLSDELCEYAQEWAEALSIGDALQYRKRPRFGESVMSVYSNDPHFMLSGEFPVNVWYDEISEHTFGVEPENTKSDHFCQIVWQSTKNLGVGLARSGSGSYYVVSNYFPTGIRSGQYVENVLACLGDIPPPEDFLKGADQPDFLEEIKKNMQEIKEVVDKMEEVKEDATAIPDMTKEVKEKAQELVDNLQKIKDESEQIKKVPDPQTAKEKIEGFVTTWKTITEADPDAISAIVTEVMDETNAAVDEMTNAITEFEEKREQAIQMTDVVDEANTKAEAMMQTITDIDAEPERVQELFDDLKQKISELVDTIANIEEKRTNAIQIPDIVDKIVNNVDVVTTVVEKLKANEEFSQAQPDIIGEFETKTQEVVEAVEQIKTDEEYAVVKQILLRDLGF